MFMRSKLTRGEGTLICFVAAGLTLFVSGVVLAFDSWGAAPGADWQPVGVTVLICALPVGFALCHLKKLELWFAFGLWLGTFLLLPWIPWCRSKQFFAAVARLEQGMSVTEARYTMKGFREVASYSPGGERRLVIDSPDKEAIAAGRLVWVTHQHFEDATPPKLESLTYRWDPDGSADGDAVILNIEGDRINSIEIRRD